MMLNQMQSNNDKVKPIEYHFFSPFMKLDKNYCGPHKTANEAIIVKLPKFIRFATA